MITKHTFDGTIDVYSSIATKDRNYNEKIGLKMHCTITYDNASGDIEMSNFDTIKIQNIGKKFGMDLNLEISIPDGSRGNINKQTGTVHIDCFAEFRLCRFNHPIPNQLSVLPIGLTTNVPVDIPTKQGPQNGIAMNPGGGLTLVGAGIFDGGADEFRGEQCGMFVRGTLTPVV